MAIAAIELHKRLTVYVFGGVAVAVALGEIGGGVGANAFAGGCQARGHVQGVVELEPAGIFSDGSKSRMRFGTE